QNAQSRRNAVELPATMIGHDQCVCSHVDCTPGILRRVDPLDHNRPVPRLTNPLEIVPSHNGLLKSSSDVGIQHRPFARDNDILKLHQTAVREKSRQPAWPNEKLTQKRQHQSEFSTKKFFRAIAKVTCSETCDRRVNCDHQCRKPGLPRAVDTAQCTVATAKEIKLVPNRPSR